MYTAFQRARAVSTLFLLLACSAPALLPAADESLVGHWKLAGDAQDSGPNGNHAQNHGADLAAEGRPGGPKVAAGFDGRQNFLEAPASPSLRLGTGDFSVAVWVHTAAELDDVLGNVVSMYDPAARRGFSLSLHHNVGGTTSQANYRDIHFGIDNDRSDAAWTDRGRLGNAVFVFALAVHDGQLFAGTTEAEPDAAGRVFRYDGNSWTDCGAPDKANSIAALAVHDGQLYASSAKYRLGGSALAESENPNPGGRIFRYRADGEWEDCGQLPGVAAIAGLVVYRGKLYASSLYAPAGLFRYEGGQTWTSCGSPNGKRCEQMCVFDGSLFATGYDEGAIYRFDGENWTHAGHLGTEENTQTYSFAVYQGKLYVGTWRSGRVFRYEGDDHWVDVGRLGEELEVMGCAVYNGQLYEGTLPLAEVFRYDGDGAWTSTGRLDQTPDVKYRRAWTMAVFQGKLFCGTLPSGRVYSYEAGKSATYDRVLPAGWNHLAAVKRGRRLLLYVNGRLSAQSSEFDPADYDLSCDQPLKIGFGPHDYFNGRLSDLRLYGKGLSEGEVRELGSKR